MGTIIEIRSTIVFIGSVIAYLEALEFFAVFVVDNWMILWSVRGGGTRIYR